MATQQKPATGRPHQKEDLWEKIKALPAQATEALEAHEPIEATAPAAQSELPSLTKAEVKAETPSPIQFPKKAELAESISAAVPDVSPVTNDLTDVSLLPAVVGPSDASVSTNASDSNTGLVARVDRFPDNLLEKLGISISRQNGKAFVVIKGTANSNPHAFLLGSRKGINAIRERGANEGFKLRKSDISDLISHLQAQAENAGILKDIWCRTAPTPGGVVIDLGDDQHTHVMITAGKVEIVSTNSPVLFHRTPMTQPMVIPAEVGNLDLLKKYLNLHPVSIVLFLAWLSYTLSRAKVPESKFVILVLKGSQGCGKSLLCHVIKSLIDPAKVALQVLPSNAKDIAIAAQNAHVLCFDNVREFSQMIADTLCVASTGGAMCQRQLYTDDEQSVLNIHVALVLNGIHSFIDQPDLAQRCLPLELQPFSENKRKSEAQFMREFQQDLPAILRGLFDLTAQILTHLPTAEVTNPERMYDFVHWLAAMEQAQGSRAGDYQALYSYELNQGQLDSILDNVFGATVLEFAQGYINGEWTGTPANLLIRLNELVAKETLRSREWPQNPNSMSKRLIGLQASLRTQGVFVEFGRGKYRTITITSTTTITPHTKKSNGANNDDNLY